MSKKIFSVIVLLVGMVIGLWVWTFAAPSNTISIGGSASVDPILQQLTTTYKKKTKNSFVYSSTGSEAGISNVKNGLYDIGFISKSVNPKDLEDKVNNNSQQELKESNSEQEYYDKVVALSKQQTDKIYNTINFANDSIVFVYNIEGTGFDKFVPELDFLIKFDSTGTPILADNDKGKRILKAIFSPNSQNKYLTWKQLAKIIIEEKQKDFAKDDNTDQSTPEIENKENEKIQELNEELKNVSDKMQVIPFSTTPGSGTRSSFEKISGTKIGEGAHTYNSNGSIFYQLAESKGSFGFLSMTYAINVQKEKYSTLKTVLISEQTGETIKTTIDVSDPNVNWKNYPLYRPFVLIFKNNLEEKRLRKVTDFVFWLSKTKEAISLYENEKIQPVFEDLNEIEAKEIPKENAIAKLKED